MRTRSSTTVGGVDTINPVHKEERMRSAAIWIMVVAAVLAMQIRKEMAGIRKKMVCLRLTLNDITS